MTKLTRIKLSRARCEVFVKEFARTVTVEVCGVAPVGCTAVPYNSTSGSVWEVVNTDMQSQP